MRLNRELIEKLIEVVDEHIEKYGWDGKVRVHLSGGLSIQFYRVYPYYYRFEILDRGQGDIEDLLIIDGGDEHVEND